MWGRRRSREREIVSLSLSFSFYILSLFSTTGGKEKEDSRSSCSRLTPRVGAAAGMRFLPSPAPSGAANWGGNLRRG